MLNIVLVTRDYAETGAPSGLAAAALAQALAGLGHAVHVICAMSPAARPHHEVRGLITTHRLGARRTSPPQAFAAQVSRRVHELLVSRRCDAIQCLDAPECLLALSAMRASIPAKPGLLSVVVDPRSLSRGDALADAVIRNDARDSIPFPLADGLWSPPAVEGPCFVISDPGDQHDEPSVMRAYQRSQARSRGWSLALRARDGGWRVHHADHRGGLESCTMLIAPGPQAPVASMHALRAGDMSIISDRSPLWAASDAQWPLMYEPDHEDALVAVLDRAARTPADEHRRHARFWFNRLGPLHTPGSVARQHERLIRGTPRASVPTLDAWRSLERTLATPHAGATA